MKKIFTLLLTMGLFVTSMCAQNFIVVNVGGVIDSLDMVGNPTYPIVSQQQLKSSAWIKIHPESFILLLDIHKKKLYTLEEPDFGPVNQLIQTPRCTVSELSIQFLKFLAKSMLNIKQTMKPSTMTIPGQVTRDQYAATNAIDSISWDSVCVVPLREEIPADSIKATKENPTVPNDSLSTTPPAVPQAPADSISAAPTIATTPRDSI